MFKINIQLVFKSLKYKIEFQNYAFTEVSDNPYTFYSNSRLRIKWHFQVLDTEHTVDINTVHFAVKFRQCGIYNFILRQCNKKSWKMQSYPKCQDKLRSALWTVLTIFCQSMTDIYLKWINYYIFRVTC